MVTETIKTTKVYSIMIYSKLTGITFSGTQTEIIDRTTTVIINEDGQVEKVGQNITTTVKTFSIAPLKGFTASNVITESSSKFFKESELLGALKSAVEYVKEKKVSTGYSPSQLNAQKLQKSMSYVSLTAGGLGTADAVTGGRVLGAVGSKALGLASLFPTLCDWATDYSGRSNPINYKVK
jgi:hypothetical protein